MLRLEGKVTFVTGAASGIGRSIAIRYAQEGAKVILSTDRNEKGLNETAAEIGENALPILFSVTDPDAWKSAVEEGEARFGSIDVLVNCAGFAYTQDIEGTTVEMLQKSLDVNAIGAINGMQAVAESMKGSGGGAIVNIATAGIRHMDGACFAYCVSKAAEMAASKCAAQTLAKYQIRVNTISPGAIKTPGLPDDMEAHVSKQIPLGRVGATGDIAAMAVALASDEFAYCSGQDFVVDGAYSGIFL